MKLFSSQKNSIRWTSILFFIFCLSFMVKAQQVHPFTYKLTYVAADSKYTLSVISKTAGKIALNDISVVFVADGEVVFIPTSGTATSNKVTTILPTNANYKVERYDKDLLGTPASTKKYYLVSPTDVISSEITFVAGTPTVIFEFKALPGTSCPATSAVFMRLWESSDPVSSATTSFNIQNDVLYTTTPSVFTNTWEKNATAADNAVTCPVVSPDSKLVASPKEYDAKTPISVDLSPLVTNTTGLPVFYSLPNPNPLKGTITNFDPTTGRFTYTPKPGVSGTDVVWYSVCTNSSTLCSSAPLTFNLDNAPTTVDITVAGSITDATTNNPKNLYVIGDKINYKATITNLSDPDATNIEVSINIPVGLSNITVIDNNTGATIPTSGLVIGPNKLTIPSIKGKQNLSLTVQGTITDAMAAGQFINQVVTVDQVLTNNLAITCANVTHNLVTPNSYVITVSESLITALGIDRTSITWKKDGTEISGATKGSTYTVTADGSYNFTAKKADGSVACADCICPVLVKYSASQLVCKTPGTCVPFTVRAN